MNYPLMKPRRLTVKEFREMELNAPEEERWELIDGRIVRSMAGGSKIHNLIVYNVQTALMTEFRRRRSSCRAFAENVRLDMAHADASTLPDVLVHCEPWRDGPTTVSDAAAIVEVLSPSTSAFDLGEKLRSYLALPSLQTYALIEQNQTRVLVYTRTEMGWLRREFSDLGDDLTFEELQIAVPLALIYEDVEEARANLL